MCLCCTARGHGRLRDVSVLHSEGPWRLRDVSVLHARGHEGPTHVTVLHAKGHDRRRACIQCCTRGAHKVDGRVRAAQRGSMPCCAARVHAPSRQPGTRTPCGSSLPRHAAASAQLAVCRSQLARHSLNYRVANCSNYTINHRYVLLPDSFRVQSSQKLSD